MTDSDSLLNINSLTLPITSTNEWDSLIGCENTPNPPADNSDKTLFLHC